MNYLDKLIVARNNRATREKIFMESYEAGDRPEVIAVKTGLSFAGVMKKIRKIKEAK
jgi:hypothetical protein